MLKLAQIHNEPGRALNARTRLLESSEITKFKHWLRPHPLICRISHQFGRKNEKRGRQFSIQFEFDARILRVSNAENLKFSARVLYTADGIPTYLGNPSRTVLRQKPCPADIQIG